MNYSPETRSTLLARIRGAIGDRFDEAAWAEFVGIYEPLILRFMQQQGLQHSDSLDGCQQVMLGLSDDIKQWKSDGRPASFRRWLFRVARNRVLKVLENSRHRPQGIGGSSGSHIFNNIESDAQEVQDAFNREYQEQTMLWAADQIRDEFRTTTWKAFWDTCVLSRPIIEVAAELGLSVGSIYVARSRIVARLRDKVKYLEIED